MKTRVVGVIGGMGPEATVDFMAAVIAMTPAEKDQDHVRMIVDHNPGVPDRQVAIRGDRSTVSAELTEMALRLEAAGADFLVMPCNTAHIFLDSVLPNIHVPFLHIVNETVSEVGIRCPKATRVGVLATTICVESGIYQAALAASDRSVVLPDAGRQQALMSLIFRIKRGDKGDDVRTAMRDIANALVDSGAAVVVAGCTEIPLVLEGANFDVPFISSTEVLARRTIALALDQSQSERS